VECHVVFSGLPTSKAVAFRGALWQRHAGVRRPELRRRFPGDKSSGNDIENTVLNLSRRLDD
jgi:hypothetical protein